jgi:hypothetical protein
MRGLRSTILLFAVLVGLGAYIYFVASKTDDSTTTQDRLFTGLESDSIEELTVRNETGDVTTLKKENGAWQVVSPVATRGSDMEASAITSALAGLDVTRVVDENPASVSDYGLDKPRLEVEFKSAEGKPSGKLLIGSKTTTGGSLYARKNDEPKVVLIGEYNQATFNKSTFDLRDKAIVTFDREKVDGFDAIVGTAAFELAKKDGNWAVAKPIAARADQSAADGLVNSIGGLQMSAIASTSPTPDEMKKFGLDKPSAVVNLHLGSARASVALGANADENTVYVRDVSRPDVFTIQKTAADDLRKTVSDYRRKDLFEMRAFTATRLEITRNGQTLAFDKVKGEGENAADTWKRVSPTPADPDKDKFQTFVAALADIRTVSFVDSAARTGLASPAMTVVAKYDDGKKEERVLFAKSGADAYASRPDDPGASKIDAEKLDEALKSVDEFAK